MSNIEFIKDVSKFINLRKRNRCPKCNSNEIYTTKMNKSYYCSNCQTYFEILEQAKFEEKELRKCAM